jgi:thiol-disulfide isomerase/thioredoxin
MARTSKSVLVSLVAAVAATALCLVVPRSARAQDKNDAKAKSPLQLCLDSTLAIAKTASAAANTAAKSRDTAGVRAAYAPVRAQAKECLAAIDPAKVTGTDVSVLSMLQFLNEDYDAGLTTLRRYVADGSVPAEDRSKAVETAQRGAMAGNLDSGRTVLASQFVDLADSVGFPRGELNTRVLLAQLYRGNPMTVDKSYPLIRDVLRIAKEDPDTTNRAKRARAFATIVTMAGAWARQDGRAYDYQIIKGMADEVFNAYPAYRIAFDPHALVGMHAEPISAPRWLNADDKTTTKSFGDGKPYLVEFTAHWCGPCRASYESIENIHNKYKAKGLDILFATQTYGYYGEVEDIKPDAELDSLKTYFGEHKIDFPVAVTGAFSGVSPDDAKNDNFVNYGATGLPTIVLIDRTGIIRGVWRGWGDGSGAVIEAEVAKVMGDTASSKGSEASKGK